MVSDQLTSWYQLNKRDLPWRETRDPYFIWLSEVILQQTRVAQGFDYYLRFTNQFPDVSSLANASEDEVLKLWQGLGYYSRARNLHHAAKEIVSNYKGNFPKEYNQIRSLKGIGDYTAAAIASFAFDLPYAVLDGNVFRFLSRYYGIDEPINSPKAKKIFSELAQDILNKRNPAMHNQAIMEFGALQCTPTNPNCSRCPIIETCSAYHNKQVASLPIKIKKVKVTNRYFYYFIILDNGNTFIHQRTGNDIWKGLFQFPLFESPNELTDMQIAESNYVEQLFNSIDYSIVQMSESIKHILTHRHIYTKFIIVEIKGGKSKKHFDDCIIVELTQLSKFAWPRVIDRYFEKQKFDLIE